MAWVKQSGGCSAAIRRRVRALASGEGAEIAEAALVLPLVFMFLLGIVWFGRAFNIYSTITQAAQQGAQAAARRQCATCGNGAALEAAVDAAVFSVMDASSLDRGQIQPPSPAVYIDCPAPAPPQFCGTANNIHFCQSVVLNAPSGDPQCGTVVTFRYPFRFYLPFTSLNSQQVVMTAHAQSRMEN